MENFILGADSLINYLSITIQAATNQPIFWGFFIGFLIATLIHGFIISGNPKYTHIILFNKNKKSYEIINKKSDTNTKKINFSIYEKIAIQTKFIFSLSLLLFLLLIILAITIY